MSLNSEVTTSTVSLPGMLKSGSDASFRELIALLYAVSGRLQAMRRDLAKAFGVRVAEFSVLMGLIYLERAGKSIRIRTVADHLRVSGSQVTAIVRRLEQDGWVEKSTDPEDNRAVSLTLTDKTWKRMASFTPFLLNVNDSWFEGTVEEDIDVVRLFLLRLVRQYDRASLRAQDISD